MIPEIDEILEVESEISATATKKLTECAEVSAREEDLGEEYDNALSNSQALKVLDETQSLHLDMQKEHSSCDKEEA